MQRALLVLERARPARNADLRGDHLHGKRNAVYRSVVGPGPGHPRVAVDDSSGTVRQRVVEDDEAWAYGLNADALGGGTLQLNAIAAAVIGGTSLFGGRGRVYHAVLGALVVGSVQNGLDLLGEPAAVKNIATGVILVVAVVLDALGRRRRLARGSAE